LKKINGAPEASTEDKNGYINTSTNTFSIGDPDEETGLTVRNYVPTVQ